MPNSPANSPLNGRIMDDVTVPNSPSGCNPPPPGSGKLADKNGCFLYEPPGVGWRLAFEKDSGLVVNNGGWFGHLDEALFDLDPQNDLPV